MTTKKKRKGRLTIDEQRFIEDNISDMTYEEMGRQLEREPSTLRKYAARKKLRKQKTETEIRVKEVLHNSPHMKQLRKQFTEEEMERVKHDWTNITEQFKGDILYTEEMQILDYIRIGVLMDRFLSQEKQLNEELDKTDKVLQDLESKAGKPDAPKDLRSKIEYTSMQKGMLMGEIGEAQKGYKDLIDKREKAAKSIKGSREQRSKSEHLSKATIKDWVVNLNKNPNKKRDIGYEIEKMRIGIKEEYIRLSEVHQYFNGDLDLPVLNSDTVKNLEGIKDAWQNDNDNGDNGPDGGDTTEPIGE